MRIQIVRVRQVSRPDFRSFTITIGAGGFDGVVSNQSGKVSQVILVQERGDTSLRALQRHFRNAENPSVAFDEPIIVYPGNESENAEVFIRCDANPWCFDAPFGIGRELTACPDQNLFSITKSHSCQSMNLFVTISDGK